jgi:pimeloyl-ACP methyl ester carboxylesterase
MGSRVPVLLAAMWSAFAANTFGAMVDVGGHELRIKCRGQGAPTVVLESGLGDTLDTWDEVVPEIAKVTRVCAYDRGGLGRSDPGPLPRTSEQVVKELEILLGRSALLRPYVLVGHSFGGLNVRLFAARHQGEVAGLVLVDSTPESYPTLESGLRTTEEMSRIRNSFRTARPAAKSEFDSLIESASQVRNAGPLPDVPVVVIAAGAWKGDSASVRETWLKLQSDLCRQAPQCRQVVAEQSGHYVQFDEPEIVVEAILDVIQQERSGASRRSRRVSPGR